MQEPVTLSSSTRTFPVLFTAGNLTVLYGDVDDVVVDNGKSEVDNFGPVCKIGDIYYTNLTDAVAAYSGTAIEVFRNIDYGGSFSKNFKICPIGSVIDGSVVGNNRCYVKNITMAAGTKVEFVAELTDTSGITYTGSGTLNFLSWSDVTCFADTTGGSLTINSSGTNLYHTGTCVDVTVTDAKKDKAGGLGYHCWGEVTGTLTVTKGYVDLGDVARVGSLTVNSSARNDADITGKRTTTVGNMNYIYEGTSNGTTALSTAAKSGIFKAITFDGNGGKSGTASLLTKYGIEGMYLYTLPQSGVFTRTDVSVANPVFQQFWSVDKYGSSPVYWCDTVGSAGGNNTRYLVGSGDTSQKLFAAWEPLSPLGGYVFAICSGGVPSATQISGNSDGTIEVNGVKYQFFNSSGKPLNLSGKTYKAVNSNLSEQQDSGAVRYARSYSASSNNSLLVSLKSAKYYRIINKPASGYQESIYVCPTDGFGPGGKTGNKIAWGGGQKIYNSISGSMMTAMSKWLGVVDAWAGEPVFGRGKSISASTIAATDGTFDIYKNAAGNSATIWSYIDWLNHGNKSSATGTPWASTTTSEARNCCCNDWFVPTCTEIDTMYRSGVLDSAWFTGSNSSTYILILSCSQVGNVHEDYLDKIVCATEWCRKTSDSTIRTGFNGGAVDSRIFGTIPCRSF